MKFTLLAKKIVKKIPPSLWKLQCQYSVRKHPPLVHIMSHITQSTPLPPINVDNTPPTY